MLIHKPRLVILDEIDSGLDVDALAVIGRAVTHLRNEVPSGSIMVITHYQRILTYIVPDYVHIMYKGSIVASGTMSLVHTIEMQGYNAYR
jgi:Fe-S cluster assembly ATP-binding protein